MSKKQNPISEDGVSISLKKTAEEANKNVDRINDIPVHVCGQVSHRECPCWKCVSENCAACFATLF